MKALLVFLILWAGSAQAAGYRLLDVDQLDVEYGRIMPASRDPYVPQHTGQWRDEIALQWNLTLLEWGYWRNHVHTETSGPGGTVTTVGWQFEAGVHLGQYFDLYREHHSRHVMEESPEARFSDSHAQFPVEDIYGIRFHVYGREKS